MWFSRKLSYLGSLSVLYAAILGGSIAGCRERQGQETPKQDIQIYCTIDDLTRRVDNLENECKEKEYLTKKKIDEKRQSPESLERQLEEANVTIAEQKKENKRLRADYARVWGYLYDKQEDKFFYETLDKLQKDEDFRNKLYEKIKPGILNTQSDSYEKFKQDKLGERYSSLSDEHKRGFDKTFGPQDWRMLDRIHDGPLCYIEETAKELKSPEYLERYLRFRKMSFKDLDGDLRAEIRDNIFMLNLDNPTEFDKAVAFVYLETKRILDKKEFINE